MASVNRICISKNNEISFLQQCLFVVLFLLLTTFDVLFYLVILWATHVKSFYVNTRTTFLCFMQQGVNCTEDLNIMWFFAGTFIDITHTNTHTHTQKHSQNLIHYLFQNGVALNFEQC